MALSWFLTAFMQLLGLSDKLSIHLDSNKSCTKAGLAQGSVKSLKDTEAGLYQIELCKEQYPNDFQMPLHYPHYSKADYEKMEDWKLDMVLREYGLRLKGSLEEKRAFAIGTFLWPNQL
ncbi:Cytoplasmic tRNA 2-thiolation protein 1 [Quillaja saponaria]|uniref:Cytoplasmic tRNA 2-thiolation protein 1 n=1 Tax=Quillaja saponaria TaxID=32244 RepID=A0AAD7LSR1_QUISA|nr:Cytoplasmic tRNA 2-thiolation protein 1 [Quillaja saponaria]